MTQETKRGRVGPRVLIVVALVLSAAALGVSVNQRRAMAAAATHAPPEQPLALIADHVDESHKPGRASREDDKRAFRSEPMFSNRVNAVRRELFDLRATDGMLTHAQVERLASRVSRLASMIELALAPGAAHDDHLIALVAFRAIGNGGLWDRIEESARETMLPAMDIALWADRSAIRLAALRCVLVAGLLDPGNQNDDALAGAIDHADMTQPESRLILAWANTTR